MDTELLRAFVAVAEGESFSAAGQGLHRTQSTVSLQIKRLEERLGQSLFQRTSRSVALTDAGRELLPYARRILKLEQQAERALGRHDTHERIRLGITDEQAIAYLPTILPDFTARYPTVRLELACDLSTQLLRQLEEGLLDVVLNIWHKPNRSGEIIGREPLIWAATPDYHPGEDGVLALALNAEGCIFRAHALSALDRAERHWRIRYTGQSPIGLNQPVQVGLAVTIKTPRSLPSDLVDVGQSLALPDLGYVDIEMHRTPGQLSEVFVDFCDRLQAAVVDHDGVIPSP